MAKNKSKNKSTIVRADGFLNLVITKGNGDTIRHGTRLYKDARFAKDDWQAGLLKAAKKQHKVWMKWDALSKKEKKAEKKAGNLEPEKYLQIKVEAYVVNTGGKKSKKTSSNEW